MSEPGDRAKIPKRVTATFKGPNGSKEIEAKADTGADRITIDHSVARTFVTADPPPSAFALGIGIVIASAVAYPVELFQEVAV